MLLLELGEQPGNHPFIFWLGLKRSMRICEGDNNVGAPSVPCVLIFSSYDSRIAPIAGRQRPQIPRTVSPPGFEVVICR
ncbi:hypothetical protein VIGAN_07044000 [Vigna angularis var. angularis]|uniref:Uncharacterized protein n=1 Tax=Vigna angularis var. angularis TaxID=157739 RepID=A0A0S3SG96_PHAAN|nr:hypothetical protein VIGAN_07044000 [Vigna angularis var. angularis]